MSANYKTDLFAYLTCLQGLKFCQLSIIAFTVKEIDLFIRVGYLRVRTISSHMCVIYSPSLCL